MRVDGRRLLRVKVARRTFSRLSLSALPCCAFWPQELLGLTGQRWACGAGNLRVDKGEIDTSGSGGFCTREVHTRRGGSQEHTGEKDGPWELQEVCSSRWGRSGRAPWKRRGSEKALKAEENRIGRKESRGRRVEGGFGAALPPGIFTRGTFAWIGGRGGAGARGSQHGELQSERQRQRRH